jgi:cation diffusion facilitator family transporter
MNNAKDLAVKKGVRSALYAIAVNACLVVVKAVTGILGNSYALVADAIESASDVLISIVMIVGLKFSRKPADHKHPYGHGKFEPLAAVVVALALIVAAFVIAIESYQEIKTPHHAPELYTLFVLVAVIFVKEGLFRFTSNVADEIKSTAIRADAWHHRSDAITSAAAFVGISIALIGGPGYESADDFAALLAAVIICLNAIFLIKPALDELLDSAPDRAIVENIREIAMKIEGVLGTHKCHVRKVGFDFFVELDVLCDPSKTIREGHEIAHAVGAAIQEQMPEIAKVLVHLEPVDDYGLRSDCVIGTDLKV